MFPEKPDDAVALISEWSELFLDGPENDLGRPSGPPEPAFGRPLIGCAAGDDPYWHTLSREIAPGHFTPQEAFQLAFPDDRAEPSELSIVSWILPQTEATLRDQRSAGDRPSERWVRNRYYGQKYVIEGLAGFVIERLRESGIQALAPDLLPRWKEIKKETPLSSAWSHRHAAFAAGLGTFGLCDGLITPLGKAMRTLSIVVRHKLPVTDRDYNEAYEYCLHHSYGRCGACVRRCPAGAISLEKGHDKKKCQAFLDHEIIDYVAETWPDLKGAYGCGLCQTAVPCEKRIPRRPQDRSRPSGK